MAIHAYRTQASQHECGTVDVVHAPSPKPRSIRFLLVADESKRLLHHRMILVVTVGSQHLENASGDVYRGRVQHGIVIGKRHVLEHHAIVVLVERRPPAVAALHREDPINGALDGLPQITSVRMLHMGQCQADHRAVINIWVELIVEFEIPAAGLPFRIFYFPVADAPYLLLQNPIGAFDDPRIIRRHAALTQSK